MAARDEYLEQAERCRLNAEESKGASEKADWLELRSHFLDLADFVSGEKGTAYDRKPREPK
jgi:hypothetical protein